MFKEMKSNLGQACICVFPGPQGIEHNELLDSKVVFGGTDVGQVTQLYVQELFPSFLLATLPLCPTPASAKIILSFWGHGAKIPSTGFADEAPS